MEIPVSYAFLSVKTRYGRERQTAHVLINTLVDIHQLTPRDVGDIFIHTG